MKPKKKATIQTIEFNTLEKEIREMGCQLLELRIHQKDINIAYNELKEAINYNDNLQTQLEEIESIKKENSTQISNLQSRIDAYRKKMGKLAIGEVS